MVQAQYFGMGRRHDYQNGLEFVIAPVLVIHGEKDLQPEKASRMYANLYPNAEFQIIKNAATSPSARARKLSAKSLENFCKA